MSGSVRAWTAGSSLLAVLLLGAWPSPGSAASLNFRNDMPTPVIVRGASIVNGVVRLGPPHLVQPNDTCSDPILFPGNKLISIHDAKQPARLLFRGTIRCGATDQFFSIRQVEPRPDAPKSTTPPPPEVKLEPLPAPAPTPKR
jgi:hypothetical protein